MRSSLLFVAVLLAALVAPSAASACTIAAPPPGHDPLEKADIAVYGEVVSRQLVSQSETPSPNAEYDYRFRIVKTYKGRPARTITLLAGTESSMCEAGLLKVGDRFGLLLYQKRGPFRIDVGSFISRGELEKAKRRRR